MTERILATELKSKERFSRIRIPATSALWGELSTTCASFLQKCVYVFKKAEEEELESTRNPKKGSFHQG